jgi:hypothetical protein
MRGAFGIVVGTCALLALACQGPKGDAGPAGAQGVQGPAGPAGPAGTFSGTFTGDAGIIGSLTVNGQDLFAASMQGLAPAVFGNPYGFGAGHIRCGAPTTLDLGATISANNASYGEIIYTTQGAFNLSQNTTVYASPCANVCVGPLTFFLSSPSAQTIVLQGQMDNGPSNIYLDGAIVATPPANANFNQGVNVPQGPFALSLVACSNDGFSTSFFITNQWITTYNLSIDIDRTFHRNGK